MPDNQDQVHEDWWSPPQIPPQGSDLGTALARVGNIPTQSTPDLETIEPQPLIPRSLSEGVANRAQNLWHEFQDSRLSGQTAAGVGATLDPMAAIPGANSGLIADELRAMYHSRLGTRDLPPDYDLYRISNAENAAKERFANENPETAQTMGAVMEAGLSHPSGMGHVPPAAETALEKGRSFVEQNAPGPNQLNIFLPARARQVEIASKLEEQGVHPNSILKQTGAFRDVDGRWMREISDANSRVVPSEDFLKQYEGASGPAEAMFEHEKLYKEAPGLKRYIIDYAHQPEFLTKEQSPGYEHVWDQRLPDAINLENNGYSPKEILQRTGMQRNPDGEWTVRTQPTGTHVASKKIIEAEGATPEQLRSATLHELTHAVDRAIGRQDYGANSENIYQQLLKVPPHDAVQLGEQSRAAGSRQAPNIADYQDDWDGYLRHLADDMYWRRQDEVRARNVERRRNMTDWERRNKHASETMDVPVEQQIAGSPSKFGISRSEPGPPSPPIQRSIDPLGYYSHALESAKTLPQAKGTPEQMLAQLKKAGVKDAEIQATNLPQFLEGKKSVTRDEIAQHLEDNRVSLNQTLRDSYPSFEALNAKSQELYGRPYSYNTDFPEEYRRPLLEAISPGYLSRERPKWSEHSLDSRNPTYRETVLHLPDPREQIQAKREDVKQRMQEGLHRYRQETGYWGVPDTEEQRALQAEMDELNRQSEEARTSLFHSGHFEEPNITGHLMTSMVKDQNGHNVFNVDQIQSDWGQKLREGGVRDEAKIANLEADLGRANEESRRIEAEAGKFIETVPDRDRNVASYLLSNADPYYQVSYGPRGDVETLANYGEGDIQRKAREFHSALKDAFENENRIEAELYTAKQSPYGHPLVNTTDQWVNTALRQAIKQAAENGADAISIPHGDTVLSYNPEGMKGPNGMREFYGRSNKEGIVTKNLRKILKSYDQSHPGGQHVNTFVTPTRGETNRGKLPISDGGSDFGFTVFPLTDKIKQSVVKEGQPLFASGGSVSPKGSFQGTKIPNIKDRYPDMVPKSGSFTPKEGLQPDDPNFGNFRAIGASFKYNEPPDARESTLIEDRRFTHPSLPTSDFGMYNGPMMGGISSVRPAPPSSAAGVQGMSGTQSGPSVNRAPWTAASISPFTTEVVPTAQAHGGSVTMDNSMTKGPEEPNHTSSVNPQQNSFIPEHLPEHERGFLNNPDDAHERSRWLVPYLRAGSESVKRGGDFFGGDDQYERELQALKHFYHGQQAPVAPEAPVSKKHGGAVNGKNNPISKQLNSIRDTFTHKLQDKERMIVSLEKAVARKPNAKLSKRIAKEKSEAQRIHEHLEKIMAHG